MKCADFLKKLQLIKVQYKLKLPEVNFQTFYVERIDKSGKLHREHYLVRIALKRRSNGVKVKYFILR